MSSDLAVRPENFLFTKTPIPVLFSEVHNAKRQTEVRIQTRVRRVSRTDGYNWKQPGGEKTLWAVKEKEACNRWPGSVCTTIIQILLCTRWENGVPQYIYRYYFIPDEKTFFTSVKDKEDCTTYIFLILYHIWENSTYHWKQDDQTQCAAANSHDQIFAY